jgi:dTDP-glucose pyrophosphorylase
MTVVIPMAGRGQRFLDAGYRVPKMLVEAHGKTLLQWSVDSLPLNLAKKLIFIGLAEHEREFALAAKIRGWYRGPLSLEFIFLPGVTGGQAQTVLSAHDLIPPDKPLLIFNIDTAFHSPTLARALTAADNDGVLGAFTSREPRFSFAAVDESGRVTRVTEKEPISDHALTGLYHYRRAGDFLAVAGEAVKRDNRIKGEFYVAPLYNPLIAQGRRFVIDACERHYILGTPAELEDFLALPGERVRRDLPGNL